MTETITPKSIGNLVREYRYRMRISTTELAKRVGISQAQVSRLENGQQGFRSGTLIRLAIVLGVKPWVFFMTSTERLAAEKAKGLKIESK